MTKIVRAVVGGLGLLAFSASIALAAEPDAAKVSSTLKAAFKAAPADWGARLEMDETMKVCTESGNAPSEAIGKQIAEREKARITYPADGKLMGDWAKGEKLAQSGYGMRFTDYPPDREIGGNCYACHQLTPKEVSYGTIGPSLLGYGKLKGNSEEAIKAAYDKIANPHVAFPCSWMPRFGTNGVLTPEQIRDVVALLMSPDSPVNK